MPSDPIPKLIAAVLVLATLAGAGFVWWRSRAAAPPPAITASAPPPPAAPSAPISATPAIRYPLEGAASAPAGEPAPAAERRITDALADLLGRQNLLSFVLPEHFVRQAVATVDALGRETAPPRLWPVVPTPGRFAVTGADGALQIADANATRYAPFVRFATSVDAAGAAALYKRFYPQFQAAYEALGFPGKYFNDRLVDVIDLLLATPEPRGPIAVVLTQVKGPIAPARPWTRYEFADPALEARPIGQKILLRLDIEQARQLKAQLRAFRAGIASP